MLSLSKDRAARKHFDVGYSIYMQRLPISHCQNEQQRVGYRSAERGHAAALFTEAIMAAGASATAADIALEEWC